MQAFAERRQALVEHRQPLDESSSVQALAQRRRSRSTEALAECTSVLALAERRQALVECR
eukprot:1160950-Pelagomonas_calceolata.AAC.3